MIIGANSNFANAQDVTIKGDMKGFQAGTVLEMSYGGTHQNEAPIDSAVIGADGKFVLKAFTEEPRQFTVQIRNSALLFQVVLAKGEEVQVTGEVVPTNRGYTVNNLVIKGSETHDLFQKHMSVREGLDKLHQSNGAKHQAVKKRLGEASAAKDEKLINEIRASAEWQAVEKDDALFFEQVEKRYADLLGSLKDSWWGPLMTLNLYAYFTPGNESLYDQLSDNAKASHYGVILKNLVKPEGFLGKPAPAMKINDLAGNAVDFGQVTKGHKLVLIDFWASWCVPCRKKIPELVALYDQYKDRGLVVVGVSIDKSIPEWKKALDEENLPYPNFHDLGESSNNWKVRAIPALFLLDSNGQVIAEKLDVAQIEKLLAQ